MKVSVETITPSKAKEFLTHNTHNRPLKKRRIEFLVNAIRSGEWEDNGDTIKFHKDGTLLDGQHRLNAIVETGRSLECAVVRGLNGEAYNTLDQNMPRSLADMLARDEEKNCQHLATMIRYVHVFSAATPVVALREKLSIKQGYAVLERSPNMRSTLATAMSWRAEKLGSIGMLAGAYQACRTIRGCSVDWADEFWESVIRGVDLEVDSAAYKLRGRLLDNRAAEVHNRMDRVNLVALIIKAWNCYATGTIMSSCRLTKADTQAKLLKVEE